MSKAQQAESTRRALLDSGRRLFADKGYAAVGTEELVRASGVTRGALYHHFRDKEALFLAVHEEVEQELLGRVAEQAEAAAAAAVTDGSAPDPLVVLQIGAAAFLDACEDAAVQRIALVDAPSVLGWDRWREVSRRHGLGLIEEVLGAAMDAGIIDRQSPRALAHLVIGSLDEAAMLVARADDDGQTKREVQAMLARQIEALRRTG
jgi:AcrR family transcriptional regulator